MTTGHERDATPEGEGGWYDRELPFLNALERDVRRHARNAAATRRRAHAARGHPAHRYAAASWQIASRSERQIVSHSEPEGRARAQASRLGPAGARVARRSLTLLALFSLIGASAFGAGRIFSGGAPDPAAVRQSEFVTVAAGYAGRDHWSLRVYTRGAELCRVLSVGETESSRCSAATGGHSLGATSALSSTRRYLFGISGASIAAVSIRASGGSSARRVPTHPLPALGASRARLGAGERWYLAVLARPVGEPDPALRIQGLDRGGRPVGASIVDCVETDENQRCPH